MLKRHVLWWLIVFQLICNTLITVSMNIAIVSMVSNDDTVVDDWPELNGNVICPNMSSFLSDIVSKEEKNLPVSIQMTRFNWTKAEQNMVLSGFFWLRYFSILPGGVVSHKYGSKRVLGYAMMICGVASSLIPFVARYGAIAVCWVRAFQGFFSSAALPAGAFSIMGKWSPPEERGKFGATFMVSAAVSAMLGDFMFGYIAQYWSWEYVFYVTSVYCCVWCVLWNLLAFDSPAKHPCISLNEKKFIENSLKTSSEESNISIPWKNILCSRPMMVYMAATNAVMWSLVLVSTYAPIYLKSMYGMKANEIGIITSVPSLMVSMLALGIAYCSDKLVQKEMLTITGVRKMCTFLGCLATVSLIVIAFAKCNLILVVSCFLAFTVMSTFANFGAPLGSMDLSPKFCGVLEGICSTSTAFQVFLFSWVINYFTTTMNIEELWRMTFFLTALFYISTNVIFLVLGTAKMQRWNFQNK